MHFMKITLYAPLLHGDCNVAKQVLALSTNSFVDETFHTVMTILYHFGLVHARGQIVDGCDGFQVTEMY